MKASVSPIKLLQRISVSRGAMFATILLLALLAFEVFNYSTTDFALTDLLGNELKFMGIRWATILSIAFCGIDFAGIARLFTPEKGRDEPVEVWYLFGAWVLAAAMNATLTWWGVSVAIVNHQSASGNAVVNAGTMAKVMPVFVAAMILLIRILLIGTFSTAGDRLFTTGDRRSYNNAPRPAPQQTYRPASTPVLRPASSINRPVQTPYSSAPQQPAQQKSFTRPEPTYHNLGDRTFDN